MKDFVTRLSFRTLSHGRVSGCICRQAVTACVRSAATTTERDAAVSEFGGNATTADTAARARALLRVTKTPEFTSRSTEALC